MQLPKEIRSMIKVFAKKTHLLFMGHQRLFRLEIRFGYLSDFNGLDHLLQSGAAKTCESSDSQSAEMQVR